MKVKTLVKHSEYHDSVSLMLVARELAKLDGVRDASVMMATDANKSIMAGAEPERVPPNLPASLPLGARLGNGV